jgi:Bacteriophage T4-like portal protein (Gp20)
MAEIQDTFTKLKLAVMGTRTQKIDAKLDQVVKDISTYRSNSGRNGYIDLVKSLISKNANVQISSSSGLFSQGGAGPSSFGQGGRILRYKTYQAIVSNINYCHRALQVLTDNILSPDDITKISLDIKAADSNDSEDIPKEAKVRRVKNVVKKIKLEEDLSSIVKNTLMFGDFFCEIGDAVTALTSKSLLSEAEYLSAVETSKERGEIDSFKQEKYTFSINYSALNEDTIQQDDKKSKEMKSLKNLKLIYHEPQFVLRLQSSLFPVCFGYLIFPQITVVPGTSIAEDAINNIVLSILKSLEKKIPQMKEFKGNDDLKHIITQMLAQSEYNKAIEIRYVAPDKMVHFKIPSNKYYPYGESIFDNGQFSAKVLIALETALAIQRLARSTEKRKIAVEVGLPRDAKKVIEKLKEEFRKRKITLDSFGTVDTIPSMITTFEDVYIPQRDGKPFVDISTFNEGNVDVRSKVDELKFIRDQLVAGLGVPPGFIGIEENISAKNTLTEENILFARTIIAHQKYLTHQVQELIEKIFDIVSPEEALTLFDTVQVSFPPPKSLQYEREARYMNEVTGLIDGLERVGIPKEYSRKKYLPQIDWDEVSKYETDVKIDQTLDPSKKDDEMDMGMGGMGGMGGAPY